MTNNSTHKQSQGASGKAPGRKVSNCLLQIIKQMSQLLWNKRNRYEVLRRPVIRSTVGSWVDPAVNVWVLIISIFCGGDNLNSIDSRAMLGHGSSYDIGFPRSVKLNLVGFDQVLHLVFQGPTIVCIITLDFQNDRRSEHSGYSGERWCWGSLGLPLELPD